MGFIVGQHRALIISVAHNSAANMIIAASTVAVLALKRKMK